MGAPNKALYQITFQSRNLNLPYCVVEGSGPVRTVVSQHRNLHAAHKAAAKWKPPANIRILDRDNGTSFLLDMNKRLQPDVPYGEER